MAADDPETVRDACHGQRGAGEAVGPAVTVAKAAHAMA
jgi:hypothetical protein